MRAARGFAIALTALAAGVVVSSAAADTVRSGAYPRQTGVCHMTASVTAANHRPHIDKRYYLTVKVSPKTTTHAKYQFLFNGAVVSTQYIQNNKNFHFSGRFRDGLLFPAHALGIALTVRVVLTNKCGRRTVDWPVKPVR